MSNSDLIALGAFLVSILAAIYAYRSWRAAEKSNQINLHSHQKEIHDAFFELKMHMIQKARFALLQEVAKFYYPAKNAKLYFEKSLANDVEKYFDICFDIADLARVEKTADENEKISTLLQKESALSKEVEAKLVKKLTLA